MPIQTVLEGTKNPVKIWANYVESEALAQLRNTAEMPFIFKHIAVMPDVHLGRGATIGSVLATKGAVIPSAVGVDIGCGMSAVKLPFSIDAIGGSAEIAALRASIERSVPVGRHGHKEMDERRAMAFIGCGANRIDAIKGPPGEATKLHKNAQLQLGSLGGGNHFIEICHDKDNMAWIMLHSGSRNIGKVLAERHIEKAKGLMKKYFVDLPDPELAFLAQGTQEFSEYLADLNWAQAYAKANRQEMVLRVLREVWRSVYGAEALINQGTKLEMPEQILQTLFMVDCHHNYTSQENHFGFNVWVTRKGAVSAREGEFGIIPGSMGEKSFIVRGLGNADSFCSCSHGAGRRMSRTQAKARYSTADLEAQTRGVDCRKDADVVDEIPDAYKDIDLVMANQADLVVPVFELKQIICVKG